jgi:SAM-dependent methyltransferase
MQGANVLDVGCGLGYYTKALSATGAFVTGLDFSNSAIEVAKAGFPECKFQQGTWPEDISDEPQFDLIWVVNFSLINTFDVNVIDEKLVQPALKRLKTAGWLVIGWNTDFSGRAIEGYSHWSLDTLKQLQDVCSLSQPIVPERGTICLSGMTVRIAYLLKRSIPIFIGRQKD